MTKIIPIKVDGPRIRAEDAFITLISNACAEIHKNPNSGTPEFMRAGLKAWAETFDQSAVSRAIRRTAKKHGLTEAQVIALFAKVDFSLEDE